MRNRIFPDGLLRALPRVLMPAACLACPLPRSSDAAPWPGDSGTDIGAALTGGYEASGIVWHDGYGAFFLVDDGGLVTLMASNGSSADDYPSLGYDLEGITVADPTGTYLYLGVENPDSIREFDLSEEELTEKSWDLTGWMTGPSNSGLEALTFVPDGHHPHGTTRSGGLFYAGLQVDGTSGDGRLYVFDVDLSENGDVARVTDFSPVAGRTDISDMHYDTRTRTLYLIYDGANRLLEMKTDGSIIAEYTLPGNDQEGIMVVRTSPAEAYVYITEDDGGSTHQVWRYGAYPVTDTDGDGLTDAEEHWHDGAVAYTPGSDTNPSSADTDGDGYTDYVERQSGSDPLAPGDTPSPLRVSFQPYASPAPSGGWCVDSGTPRGSTGYGW